VKKLITMLVIFAVMLVFAGVELWYTSNFYSKTHNNLVAANESIEVNKDKLDNPETIRLVDEANTQWEKGKRGLLMMANHHVIRYVDEKFVSLMEQVRCNNKDDASVTVKVLISFIKDLRADIRPKAGNIF